MDHRTVLITGATGGVGRAVARSFLEPNTAVVLAARDEGALEEHRADLEAETAAETTTVTAVRTDVREELECERLAAAASSAGSAEGIDTVVPAAGVYHGDPGSTPMDEESYSNVDDHWRTNVRGVYATIRASLSHLNPGARVLVPTGRVAREPTPGIGSYGVSKAGAEAVARGFAADTAYTVCSLDLGQLATDLTGGKGREPATIGPMFVWAALEADSDDIDGSVVDLKRWLRETRGR